MKCSQQEQCIAPNFGSPEMSNFDMCVMDLGFTAILRDPKFGAIHVGLPHCIALTAYS